MGFANNSGENRKQLMNNNIFKQYKSNIVTKIKKVHDMCRNKSCINKFLQKKHNVSNDN